MRERHAWILTSTTVTNTFGVVGVFKTEPEAQAYADAAGLKEDECQITGWAVESK